MFSLCKRCKCRPALTNCIRGQFCLACGENCHPKYEHPVEFINTLGMLEKINNENDSKKGNNVGKTVTWLGVANRSELPRRVSKIKVRGDVRRYPSQKIMAPLSTRVRKVTLPTLATDSSSIPQPYKPHSFKGRRQNSFGTMTAQAAVEDMAVNCSPAKSTSSPKSQTEVETLRKKVASQQRLLKKLKKQIMLEREVGHRQREEYEKKLRLLRHLAD